MQTSQGLPQVNLKSSFFLLIAAGLGSGEQRAGLQPGAKAGSKCLDY